MHIEESAKLATDCLQCAHVNEARLFIEMDALLAAFCNLAISVWNPSRAPPR